MEDQDEVEAKVRKLIGVMNTVDERGTEDYEKRG